MNKTRKQVSLSYIMKHIAGHKAQILFLMLLQSLQSLGGVLMALLLKNLVDAAVSGAALGRQALLLFVVVLSLVALRALERLLDEFTRARLENRLKKALFHRLLVSDYASVTQKHSGEWLNRLTNDTAVVANNLVSILPGLFGMLVKLVSALVLTIRLAPGLVLFILPLGGLLTLFGALFRGRLKRLHKAIQEADGNLRVFFTERLHSLMVIKAFMREENTLKESDADLAAHLNARVARSRYANISMAGFGLATQGVYALSAVYCAYHISKGHMGYGDMLAILQLVSQLQSPFVNISTYMPRYYAMLASAERLMEADIFPEDSPNGGLSKNELMKLYQHDLLAFGFQDASFQYPASINEAKPVFDKLSLNINKGESLALLGPSGSGKSTLFKLLLCLYPLNQGQAYIKTADGHQALSAQHRGLFAYVPQGHLLMFGSIRQALSFGEPELASQDDLLFDALRLACAEDFVLESEQGLDSLLGEQGSGFSEGQLQRLAIARALLSGRPILLLDEATSALDERTETKLLQNLSGLQDKTIIIISHRPSVLSICTRAISLDTKSELEKNP